jgi:hypothetical protein
VSGLSLLALSSNLLLCHLLNSLLDCLLYGLLDRLLGNLLDCLLCSLLLYNHVVFYLDALRCASVVVSRQLVATSATRITFKLFLLLKKIL